MSNRSSRLATRRGFTFIELVVVISIIVALAAIGFPTWGMISNRVKVNATDALVNSIATSITTYQTKTWTWNIGTTAAPQMRTYHIFDLNHFNGASLNPDLADMPNGTRRFFSIDGYMPPLSDYSGPSHEETYSYDGSLPKDNYTSAPQSSDPERIADPKPWDVNFPLQVLNSGYRGFVDMAQPQIKKTFINKRGQVVDAWGRPLRIAFAAKVYGTQAFGIWSAGLDKKDHLETRPSDDDLRSWSTQGAD